jgi:hypothetical protein
VWDWNVQTKPSGEIVIRMSYFKKKLGPFYEKSGFSSHRNDLNDSMLTSKGSHHILKLLTDAAYFPMVAVMTSALNHLMTCAT